MRILLIISHILILSSCSQTTERITGFDIHGIDVSRYQSDIDWEIVADQENAESHTD